MKISKKIKIFSGISLGIISLFTATVAGVAINENHKFERNFSNKTSSSENHIQLFDSNPNVKSGQKLILQAVNDHPKDWYVSTNSDLKNPINISHIVKYDANNKIVIQTPSEYKGQLFYYAKTNNNEFTNAIKINSSVTNDKNDFFNIGLYGGKNRKTFNYKIIDKKVNAYELSANNNIKINNNFETETFYNLSQQYISFFTSLMKYLSTESVKNSLDLTKLSESAQINLPLILQNWNNLRINQVNFINSNKFSYNIEQNWNNFSFNGIQLELTSKTNDENLNLTVAVPANIFVYNNGQNSYLSGTLNNFGDFTPLFANQNNQDAFLKELQNNVFSSNLLENYSNLTDFVQKLLTSITLTNIPDQITSNINNNLNSLYYQVLANKILAKQQSERIMNSKELYPGYEYNQNNFPWENLGYINPSTVKWGNPWMMGWSKYTNILDETLKTDTNSPLNINFLEQNTNFSQNLFDNTLWKSVPTLNLGANVNLIYKKIYGDTTFVQNAHTISPLGLMGLFQVNHYIEPNQNQGLVLSGGEWNFFGFNSKELNSTQIGQISTNIDKIISGLIEIYKMYDLNSIDFDYEYPVGSQSVLMSNWFYEFIKRCRKAFDALSIQTGISYKISAAVLPGWEETWQNWLIKSQPYLNSINLMTYDMVTPYNSNIAGANSKVYGLSGGSDQLNNVLSSSATSVTLTNQVTWKQEKLNKIPNYTTSNQKGLGNVAGNGIVEFVNDMVSKGVDPSKILLGTAGYGYGWQIKGNGPIPSMPGMFGVLNGQINTDQPGTNSFVGWIKNKGYKLYFNPFTGNNYVFNETTHWYFSFDFISSTLAKLEYLKKWN